MAVRKTTIPDLAPPSSKDFALHRWRKRIQEAMDVMLGRRPDAAGGHLDRMVTVRDLINAGLIDSEDELNG